MKTSASNGRTEIVIVGGGYVGFHAYRVIDARLRQEIRSGRIRITLVDPETSHTFHGWSGETVAGAISRTACNSPFRRIFRSARIIRGYATRIDRNDRTVEVRTIDGRTALNLRYDHLIIGCGVGDDLDAIPGTREFGIGLRSSGGPERLRQLIIERVEEAELERNPERRRRLLSFVVAGGGFTGVETVAAIGELLDYLRPRYSRLRDREDAVTLVHAGESILEELSRFDRLVTYATRTLVERGIRLRLGMRVARIERDRVVLRDGTAIESACIISTTGSRVREIPGGEDWGRDRDGRVLVDSYLRVQGDDAVWAGGDGAHVRSGHGEGATPANALWAIKHGEAIGKNISRLLTGRRLRPFTYRGLGQAASLGIGKGVVELKGLQFTGWTGWLMRISFFLYFVPCRRTGMRGLAEWLALPFSGRDTSPAAPVPAGSLSGFNGSRHALFSGEAPGRMN